MNFDMSDSDFVTLLFYSMLFVSGLLTLLVVRALTKK